MRDCDWKWRGEKRELPMEFSRGACTWRETLEGEGVGKERRGEICSFWNERHKQTKSLVCGKKTKGGKRECVPWIKQKGTPMFTLLVFFVVAFVVLFIRTHGIPSTRNEPLTILHF